MLLAVLMYRQITEAGPSYQLTSGFGRYFAIVNKGGTPYRDFSVEYPPLALGLFHLLGRASFGAFVRQIILVNIAAQALIAWLCFKGWGARAGWSYLALSAPLMTIVYARYDLVGVAIAVAGAYLATRRVPAAAGLAWALASFVKLWPVLLVPGLAARRHVRAFAVSVAAGLAGVAMWSAWGGTGALKQVVTYRDARGWEFESVPGSVLRLLTRGPLRQESGAWRLGAPPAVFALLLGLALVVAVAVIWWFVARHATTVGDGVAEVVVINVVLVTGTLLSPQFVVWILPWVAIAAAAGAVRIERWAAAVVGLTLLELTAFDVNDVGKVLTEIAVVARNIALVGMLVVAVAELRRTTRHTEDPESPESWDPKVAVAADSGAV